MANPPSATPKSDYDPRWFIWTIVFLVVTGISLVSYIVLSDDQTNNIWLPLVTHQPTHKK